MRVLFKRGSSSRLECDEPGKIVSFQDVQARVSSSTRQKVQLAMLFYFVISRDVS